MYAVIQKDFVIFGTGATKEEAIKDASQYTNTKDCIKSVRDEYWSAAPGELVVLGATKELVHKVEEEGGDIIFYVHNNIVSLTEERT
jgi:hypothetical protein|tara:strand:- start:45 stop:305 length:261 start_codon:yes stop_codon:yes gene_type:complete